MKKKIVFSLIILLVSSCASFNVPEFRGMESMKMEKIDGKKISFSVGVKMFNPNWLGVKIKRSNVDFFIEDQFMGKIYLEKKVKLKAKQENTLIFPLLVELEDGAILTMLKYANRDNITIQIKGRIKGGIWIFSKKMDVDEKRVVSANELRLVFGKL